jgi:excisionase family DNA binding protein
VIPTQLMTVSEVAAALRVKEKTVHQLVRDGKLSCFQVTPRQRRFTADQVQVFLATRTMEPPKMLDAPSGALLPSPKRELKSQRGDRAQLREEMRRWR